MNNAEISPTGSWNNSKSMNHSKIKSPLVVKDLGSREYHEETSDALSKNDGLVCYVDMRNHWIISENDEAEIEWSGSK
ncbi:hypothetical protein Trydic_g15569 [Trypoxylus dichotomus]